MVDLKSAVKLDAQTPDAIAQVYRGAYALVVGNAGEALKLIVQPLQVAPLDCALCTTCTTPALSMYITAVPVPLDTVALGVAVTPEDSGPPTHGTVGEQLPSVSVPDP